MTTIIHHTAPQAEIRLAEGQKILFLSGSWNMLTIKIAGRHVESCKNRPDLREVKAVDLRAVTHMDTTGALMINKIRLLAPRTGGFPLLGAERDKLDLLALCLTPQTGGAAEVKPVCSSINFAQFCALPLYYLGKHVVDFEVKIRERCSFFGHFLVVLGRDISTPHNVRWASIVHHMGQAGIGGMLIVSLLSFLIGMVLSYMTASQLANFGMQIFVVNLLEVAIMREMGVLITAILIAGRSGSSYTAQIGSMVANQEVDAMRSMGLDPMHMLVVPRVTALVVMMPLLVLAADFSGLLGGLVTVWFALDITPGMFMEALQKSIHIQNCVVGLIKAPFFAVVIACIGCFDGFKAKGSADSVGRMTTKSVVESIFMVIALDAFFALLFSSIGI